MTKPKVSDLIIEEIEPTRWLFGSSGLGLEARVADGNWTPYLPTYEKQKEWGFEPLACTNYSSTSAIEIDLNYKIAHKIISTNNLKWLKGNGYIDKNSKVNFDDNYDALISGTSPKWGNTLKAPAEAKEDFGLIPQGMMGKPKSKVHYFDKSRITKEMYAMGQEFLKRFPVNYETVYAKDYATALRFTPLCGGCFAWNGRKNGIYVKVNNKLNHAILKIKPPTIWNIMDSYEPFIKKLADDYKFLNYAIRYIIQEVKQKNVSVKADIREGGLYELRRNPDHQKDVYAFREDFVTKRKIAGKQSLIEGDKTPDRYWLWENDLFPIKSATKREWEKAVEMAEINLIPPDKTFDPKQASKFSLKEWFKNLFK